MYSIKTIYELNGTLTGEQFEKMADVYHSKYPELTAISWAPKVQKTDKNYFERRVQKNISPKYKIKAIDSREPPESSKFYFPVLYISAASAKPFRGYDLYSEKDRRRAIDRSISKNSPIFTDAISFLSDPEKTNSGLLLLAPVYLDGVHRDVAGVVSAAFRVADFFTSSFLLNFKNDAYISIVDKDTSARIFVLNQNAEPSKRERTGLFDIRLNVTKEVEIAGKKFVIEYSPTKSWLADAISWSSYAALLAGLFFCVLLLALLLAISGAAVSAQELVDSRTIALIQSKEELVSQNRRVDELYSRLKSFLSVAPAGIYETDAKGKSLFVNDEWCQITGMAREESDGDGWLNAVHPEDREMVIREWNQAVSEARPFSLEFRFRRSDGSDCWVTSTAIARYNEAGQVEAYAGAFFQIQRLKLAESKLRSLNQVFENAVEGISRLDSEGHYLYVNSSYATICGYVPSQMIGLHWSKTIWPDDFPKAQKAYEDLLIHGKSMAELRGLKQDGTPFEKEVVMIAEYSRGNEMIGHHCFMRDISARKEIEKELIVAKELAEAGSLAKSEFLATMSHEIRTPLNGVVGFLSLLSETSLNQKQKNYVESALRSSEILLSIINDILDVSKIEAGKLELEVINFNLHSILESLVSLFEEQARARGLTFTIENRCPEVVWVQGDMARIHQVLINLIGNAIKFTQKGGVQLNVICLSSEASNIKLRFEVMDTGVGIPSEALERIFEAFTQVDSSMTRRFGGTGLGLNICKKLVDLMRGRIGVASEMSKGSTFWFEINIQSVAADKDRVLDDSKSHIPFSKTGRILVVEDVQINQQVIVGLLEFLGMRTTVVANGLEALDVLRSMPFDLILMDCEMPELDGFKTTGIIRSGKVIQNADIPIVAMTARVTEGDKERCLSSGMNDYLSKPISKIALEKVLQRWLPADRTDEWIDSHQLSLLSSLNDKALVPKLVELFVVKIPGEIEEVKKLVHGGDYVQMAKVAHRAKSASANVGAKKLSQVFAAIEAAGVGGGSSDILDSISILNRYYEITVRELQSHIASKA